MGFKEIFIGFVLIGVFSISLINFGVLIAQENDSDKSILDDSRINSAYTGLNNSYKTFQNDANESLASFNQDSTSTSTGFLLLGSIINAGKVFTTMIVGTFNIVTTLIFGTLFGNSPAAALIFGVFSAILFFLIIFSLWRVFKSGE